MGSTVWPMFFSDWRGNRRTTVPNIVSIPFGFKILVFVIYLPGTAPPLPPLSLILYDIWLSIRLQVAVSFFSKSIFA